MKTKTKQITALIMVFVFLVLTLSDFSIAFAKTTQYVKLENNSENGALVFNLETLDAATKEVMSGDSITVYVIINEGYALDTLNVTDTTNNKSITYTIDYVSSGIYKAVFKMPKGNVTVSAAYESSNTVHEIMESEVYSTELYIKSNINNGYTGYNKIEPADFLTVKQTMVDGEKFKGTTIEDFWDEEEVLESDSLLIGFDATTVILFNTDDESSYYVGLANTMQGSVNTNVTDCVIAEYNDEGNTLDDFYYDYNTGLIYISKEYQKKYSPEGSISFNSIQVQLLQVFESADEEDIAETIYVDINADDIKGKMASSGYFTANINERFMEILIAEDKEARENIDEENIVVKVNSIALPSENWYYDSEYGVIGLAITPSQTSLIEINISASEEDVFITAMEKIGVVAEASDGWNTNAYNKSQFYSYHNVTNEAGNPSTATPVTWTFTEEPSIGDYFWIQNGVDNVSITYAASGTDYGVGYVGTFILGNTEANLTDLWKAVYSTNSTSTTDYFKESFGGGVTDLWSGSNAKMTFKVTFGASSKTFSVSSASGSSSGNVTKVFSLK